MIHRLFSAELKCPNCAEILDSATNATAHNTPPINGDVTVCKYCAVILEFKGFGSKMKLEILSQEELLKIKEEEPETYVSLMATAMMLRNQKKIR